MNQDKKELWEQAIKWPLYSVVIIPISLTATYVLNKYGSFRLINFLGFVFAAILILFWENLTNDLFDSETGVDEFKFHSIVNLVNNKYLINAVAYFSLLIGLTLIYLIAASTNIKILIIVIFCCFLGYLYQGPPFRFGYLGLGEPLCWTTFGPLTHSAALLAINPDNSYTSIPWKESLLIGSGPSLAITLILFCSHFHQIHEDKKYGKNSPLVILGTSRGSELIPWIIYIIYIFQLVTIIFGFIPISCILFLISFPYGLKLINLLKYSHNKKSSIKNAKFLAVKFQTLNGVGLIIGLLFNYFFI